MTTIVKIFLSSPGDVGEERVAAQRVIERLRNEFAPQLDIQLTVWEHEPLVATQPFQDQIELPSEHDVVICILWSRMGTRLPSHYQRADKSAYESGTQFEFEDAYSSWRERGRPELLVFKKTVSPVLIVQDVQDASQSLDQMRKLNEFIGLWFTNSDGSNRAALHSFQSTPEFSSDLDAKLRKLLIKKFDLLASAKRLMWTDGSPFRGLNVFDVEHAAIYCGRGRAVAEVLQRLRENAKSGAGFLLVLGMSGVGKSSLVRAGVIPWLTQPGVVEGVACWRYAILKPSDSQDNLFHGLAHALTQSQALPELLADGSSVSKLAARIRRPGAIVPLVMDGLSKVATHLEGASPQLDVRLCLVIDQLEELADEDVSIEIRGLFANVLRELAECGRVWVLATLRGDCYERLLQVSEFVQLQNGLANYVVQQPSATELSQMIFEPMRMAGLQFEAVDAHELSLGEELLAEVLNNPGSLPLLEFVLDELFQRNKAGILSRCTYTEIGGFKQAIGERAECVVEQAGANVEHCCDLIFGELVRPYLTESGDYVVVSRPGSLSKFPDNTAARRIIESLIAARIFTADTIDGHHATFRVAHEALLRYWNRLTQWIERNNEHLLVRTRLEERAASWNKSGKRRDLLLSPGKPLEEARLLLGSSLEVSGVLLEFVELSTLAERRARVVRHSFQLALGVLAVFTVLALCATWWEKQRSNSLLRDAGRADYLTAQSGFAEGKWKSGMAHLARAIRNDDTNSLAQDALWMAGMYGRRDAEPLPLFELPSVETDSYVLAQNGDVVVVLDNKHTIKCFSTRDGSLASEFVCDPRTVGLAWGQGEVLLTVMLDSSDASQPLTQVQLLDLNGTKLGEPYVHYGSPFAWLNNAGDRLLLTDGASAAVWDVKSHRLVQEIPSRAMFGLSRGRLSEDLESFVDIERVPPAICMVRDPSTIVHEIKVDLAIQWALLSPNGKWLAASSGSKIYLISVENSEIRCSIPSESEQIELPGPNGLCVFSPDNLTLAVVYGPSIELRDVETGRSIGRPLMHSSPVRSVSFSADGQSLAACSGDSLVVWSCITAKQIGPKIEAVESGGFLPNRNRLLVKKSNGRIACWSVSGWAATPLILDHPPRTQHMFASEDRVSALGDDSWTGHDLRTLKAEKYSLPTNGLSYVCAQPNPSRVIAFNSSQFGFFDINGPSIDHANQLHSAPFVSVCWDKPFVVTVSSEQTLSVWNASTDAVVGPAIALPSPVSRGVVNAVGDRLLLCGDGPAQLWDLRKGSLIADIKISGKVSTALFSRRSNLLALVAQPTPEMPEEPDLIPTVSERGSPIGDSCRLTFVDSDSGRILGEQSSVSRDHFLSVCPLGKTVFVASGTAASIYYHSDGTAANLKTHGNIAQAIYSDNGQYVGVVSRQEVLLWDIKARSFVGQPIVAVADATPQVTFSNDSQRMVIVDGNHTKIYDTRLGVPIGAPLANTFGADSVQFSPSGKDLLVSTTSALSTVWSCRPRDYLTTLQASKLAELLAGARLDPQSGFMKDLQPDEREQMYGWLKRSVPAKSEWQLVLESVHASTALPTMPSHGVTRDQMASQLLEKTNDSAARYLLELGWQHPLAILSRPCSMTFPERAKQVRRNTLAQIANDFELLHSAVELLLEADLDNAQIALELCRKQAQSSTQLAQFEALQARYKLLRRKPPPAQFASDALTRRSLIRLADDGSLKGRVFARNLENSPTERVGVYLAKNGIILAHGTVNEQGAFIFPQVDPGFYSVFAVGESTLALSGIGVVSNDYELELPLEYLTLSVVGDKDTELAMRLIQQHNSHSKNDVEHSSNIDATDVGALKGGRIAASLENQNANFHNDSADAYFWGVHKTNDEKLAATLSKHVNFYLLKDGQIVYHAPESDDGVFHLAALVPGDYSVVAVSNMNACMFSIAISEPRVASQIRIPHFVSSIDVSPVDAITGVLASTAALDKVLEGTLQWPQFPDDATPVWHRVFGWDFDLGARGIFQPLPINDNSVQ